MDLAEQHLTRARTQLLLDQPFFGAQAMHLAIVRKDVVQTLAVDGTHLFYNAAFVLSLPETQLVTAVAHEVLHCALGHVYRRGFRDPEEWNIAADYADNIILKDANFTTIPGWYYDEQYRGWTVDQVYAYRQNQRQAQQQQQSGGSGQGANGFQGASGQQGAAGQDPTPGTPSGPSRAPGAPQGQPGRPQTGGQAGTPAPRSAFKGADGKPALTGCFVDAPPMGEGADAGDGRMTEADWAIAAEQAERVAKRAGKLPACMERTGAKARESRTEWRKELREFIQQLTPNDYSWSRPNRRFLATGIMLPGIVRDALGEIAVFVDTSGSIGPTLLNAFGAEIDACASEARPEVVNVVYVDAAVAGQQEFFPGDPVVLTPKGGGGTAFQPAFDFIEQEGRQPVAAIYFTDLDSSDTPVEPSYPVLWVTPLWVTREGPFGRTIRMVAD